MLHASIARRQEQTANQSPNPSVERPILPMIHPQVGTEPGVNSPDRSSLAHAHSNDLPAEHAVDGLPRQPALPARRSFRQRDDPSSNRRTAGLFGAIDRDS